MQAIRSILWIGPAEGLGSSQVAESPLVDVTWVRDTEGAIALGKAAFDVTVLDARSPDAALRCLRRLREAPGGSTRAPVVARVEVPAQQDASATPAGRALTEAGAAAVLPRRAEPEALLEHIDRLAEARPWQPGSGTLDAAVSTDPLPGVVGQSAALREVLALARRASRSRATVLVSGETGTGKEVIARAIHQGGPRAARPFVAVNCAAFPDTLLESELFGHVRGAFTGADRDKPGLFAEADGGTIFLDEIGETSGPLQATLLRVLQEREVRPVGSARTHPIDVRVIAASNRTLRDEAARGFFREDLYYRLAVFPITLPPLRARREDLLPLAEHFLARHGERDGKPGCRLSQSAAHLLLAYDWPGNVRELENEMQRALALAEPEGLITPKLLSPGITDITRPIRESLQPGDSLRANLDRIEAWLIRRALEQNAGRRAVTARKLGVTREGLYKKMKRLGIG
jgi:transcriptional regulator with PAS, ATPase and Fis domain/CheY-like chemotaxis protein